MEEKKIRTAFLVTLLISFILMITGPGPATTAQASSEVRYLKNNIHVQKHKKDEYRASYANWTDPGRGHIVVPVNTEVSVGRFHRGFALIMRETKEKIFFEFNRNAAGMSIEQYLDLITSPEPVQLGSFSELDRKGIQEGKAYKGMTKDGVRIALGYPAPHRTPSLGKDTWYYWTNRFKSIAVEFDNEGKVKSVGQQATAAESD